MCCECVVSQSVVMKYVVSSSSSVILVSQCLQVCSQACIECHLLNILLYTFGELRLEPHLPLQASASPPAPSLLLGPSLRGNFQKGLISVSQYVMLKSMLNSSQNRAPDRE